MSSLFFIDDDYDFCTSITGVKTATICVVKMKNFHFVML